MARISTGPEPPEMPAGDRPFRPWPVCCPKMPMAPQADPPACGQGSAPLSGAAARLKHRVGDRPSELRRVCCRKGDRGAGGDPSGGSDAPVSECSSHRGALGSSRPKLVEVGPGRVPVLEVETLEVEAEPSCSQRSSAMAMACSQQHPGIRTGAPSGGAPPWTAGCRAQHASLSPEGAVHFPPLSSMRK